jgi:hypothetical protein
MKLKDLIHSVAKLVEQRDIIDHGSIRCLYSDQAVHDIESAEDCDEVGTGTIGDDDLAEKLRELCEDDRLADQYLEDLVKLEDAYRGEDIEDYLDDEKEDEFKKLEALIAAANTLVIV